LLAEQNVAAEGERQWWSRSFFGKTSRLEATGGYVAPPMDGVWARAPYLHNGSVPTLEALLDSKRRPTCWARSSRGGGFDRSGVGLAYDERNAYDTRRPGFSNQGHRYGDSLAPAERQALLEYLKTL
jgi:hypothetical protein